MPLFFVAVVVTGIIALTDAVAVDVIRAVIFNVNVTIIMTVN